MFDRFGTAVTGVRGTSLVTLVTAVGLLAVGALVNNLWAAPRVPAAGRAVLEQCAGDCNGDGTVSVDDIIKMVGIATSAAPLSECPAGDGNGDDQVTIDDLIIAVNKALSGCPCLAGFGVSPETCEQMQVFLNCGKRSWTAPNNCSLSKCDCATGTNCNYVFELANQNDCGGVWLTLMCLTQKWEQNQGRQDGTCTMTQCLCFTPPPTPVPTRTPTPPHT